MRSKKGKTCNHLYLIGSLQWLKLPIPHRCKVSIYYVLWYKCLIPSFNSDILAGFTCNLNEVQKRENMQSFISDWKFAVVETAYPASL